MAQTYGKYGVQVLDSGSSSSSTSSFTMAIGDDGQNYDIVQANMRFTNATANQWLFCKFRNASTSRRLMYRAAGAGTSSSYGSYNGSLWASYHKNSGGGSYSYAQLTIKQMHSDSNPYGDTSVWMRMFLKCTISGVANNLRNDYTHVRTRDTGSIDRIQCYFQNGNVAGYEYKVYGLGSSQ